MSSRFNALDLLSNRENIQTSVLTSRVSEMFGCNVFNDKAMKQYLAPKLYKQFKSISDSGESLSRDLADHVAESMRKWALQKEEVYKMQLL